MIPCSLVEVLVFWGCLLPLWSQKSNIYFPTLKMEASGILKPRYSPRRPHGITSENTENFHLNTFLLYFTLLFALKVEASEILWCISRNEFDSCMLWTASVFYICRPASYKYHYMFNCIMFVFSIIPRSASSIKTNLKNRVWGWDPMLEPCECAKWSSGSIKSKGFHHQVSSSINFWRSSPPLYNCL
jgi:hypothetical protein